MRCCYIPKIQRQRAAGAVCFSLLLIENSPTLQQDAHEFLIELLDTLQAEIDAAIKDQSIIPGLFGYEVLHTIRCNACNEESTNKECSIGMSLDIQDR